MSDETIKCHWCGKDVDTWYEHRDSDGKKILVCERCLKEEVGEVINEQHKQAGNIKRHNRDRQEWKNYREYGL